MLDPASEAAAGARGEAGETLAENTKARNEGLEDMGLDPQDPSGELTDPDQPDTLPSGDRRAVRQPDRRYAPLHQGQLGRRADQLPV